jgi:hypothetical protein
MPNIPVTLSKEGYDTSGLERSYSKVTATPDMFGAQIGKAFGDLGTGIGQAANALSQYLDAGQAQKNSGNCWHDAQVVPGQPEDCAARWYWYGRKNLSRS